MEKLTLNEHISIGTALRIAICDSWSARRSPILRKMIKDRIAILRKLNKTTYIYLEAAQ
jgi:hypothetical protein